MVARILGALAAVGAGIMVYVGLTVYTNFNEIIASHPTASAMQISQVCDQAMTEFGFLVVMLLSAILFVQGAGLALAGRGR